MKLQTLVEAKYAHGWTLEKVLNKFFNLEKMSYSSTGVENPVYRFKENFQIKHKERIVAGITIDGDDPNRVYISTWGGPSGFINVDEFIAEIEVHALSRVK